MHNLDKAREWAVDGKGLYSPGSRAKAVTDIILSLPDNWVDVEEVQELADQLVEEAGDFASEGLAHRYMVIAKRLRDILPTPKLPTLADMTQEEREACQWMQCVDSNGDGRHGVISLTPGGNLSVIYPDGVMHSPDFEHITPLPDLPKLQWPGGVVDAEIVDEPEVTCSGSIHTPMQPSEVPANEPWLIEVDDQKAIGARYQGGTDIPWAAAALDGSFAGDYSDNEVALIHKLVPEPPALPEGMRLADHKIYGRVVVSPEIDQDDDYLAFYSDKNIESGGSWAYLKEYELTFLDGAE